jgi:hypothetical protein
MEEVTRVLFGDNIGRFIPLGSCGFYSIPPEMILPRFGQGAYNVE